MARVRPIRLAAPPARGSLADDDRLSARLGLNVPRGWWPVAPLAKSFEAAGFDWLQVHAPPRSVLCHAARRGRHAAALRAALDTCGLRLVLHAPDDLVAGVPDHDRALDGLLDYAGAAGAEIVVYHGANLVMADGGELAARTRTRAAAEEDALRARLHRLDALGVTLAIENLAPVWPYTPPSLSHAPGYVCDLVRRLDSPRVGMTFDVGHAHITGDLLGSDAAALLEPVRDAVALFHLHDNLGARRRDTGMPSVDPVRLDLHLPPGAGRVPWRQMAGALAESAAPLVLEIHPPHRPEPMTLASLTRELLTGDPRGVDSPRAALPGRPAARPAVPPG